MIMNEKACKMHERILKLRRAAMACASEIRHFPQCGRTERCTLQGHLDQIYERMDTEFLLATAVLDAVFYPHPERWDIMWHALEQKEPLDPIIAQLRRSFSNFVDALIIRWGEVDDDTRTYLETTFLDHEWRVLSAKRAWQNGRRLPEIMKVVEHIDSRLAETFDLLWKTILSSELCGDCKLGKSAGKKAFGDGLD
jgi:hypothetical protein